MAFAACGGRSSPLKFPRFTSNYWPCRRLSCKLWGGLSGSRHIEIGWLLHGGFRLTGAGIDGEESFCAVNVGQKLWVAARGACTLIFQVSTQARSHLHQANLRANPELPTLYSCSVCERVERPVWPGQHCRACIVRALQEGASSSQVVEYRGSSTWRIPRQFASQDTETTVTAVNRLYEAGALKKLRAYIARWLVNDGTRLAASDALRGLVEVATGKPGVIVRSAETFNAVLAAFYMKFDDQATSEDGVHVRFQDAVLNMVSTDKKDAIGTSMTLTTKDWTFAFLVMVFNALHDSIVMQKRTRPASQS